MESWYNNQPHRGRGEQPGLEVVQHVNLKVFAPTSSTFDQSLTEVRQDEDQRDAKELVSTRSISTSSSKYSPLPTLDSEREKQRRRKWWRVVGAVVAVLVILAVVLGGVFGSRALKACSEDDSSASGTGGEDPKGSGPAGLDGSDEEIPLTVNKPQLIRPGSGLSVTGWRMPDGHAEMYMFYQDPQNGLRYSRCDTRRRAPGNDSACWGEPASFDSSARPGTRLAASTALWGDEYQPQIELFYIGGKTRLLGVSFNEQHSPSTFESSVKEKEVFTRLNSSLTAYWPWTIYQNSEGMLYHVRNRLDGLSWSPTEVWDNNPTNVTALPASRLAVVPTSTNFTLLAVKAGYAVFYQDPVRGRLAVAVTDIDSPERPAAWTAPWPVDGLPDVTLPERAPIAAFSVARVRPGGGGGEEDDVEAMQQQVNTYVLYLDEAADINVLYTDYFSASSSSSSSSQQEEERVTWRMATPAALRGADPDTDITCLTMATTVRNASRDQVPLEGPSDENRCYFQRGGRVVEVRLDWATHDWVVTGTVPIP